MRTKNSFKNITISIGSQIFIALLGFLSRKVFIDNLGANYLGINGLLSNVLSMIALIESGIGASIVYNLYKPLAENDRPKIIALVQLYKKAYTVIAIVMFGLSILIYPLLGKLMKDSGSIPYFTVIYFIFVAKNMADYLNAHKVSLINADQKGYIIVKVSLVFQIFSMITKIAVLMLTKNYVLYIAIDLSIYVLQTLYNSWVVEKKYPYIKTKEKHNIDKRIKDNLFKNTKALFLHNLGSYCVFGTDNILISSFVSVMMVGLYSNYTMILGQLSSILSPILSGISASVGNLIASESSNKSYFVFKVVYLINFWIYSLCIVTLYCLLEPFLNWWLGKGYLLDSSTFMIVLINWYLTGLRGSIAMFKTKAGIFVQDKYVPLIEAALNLGLSIILVKHFGIVGIFLGTLISTLSTVFWNVPRLVYKHLFKTSVWSYFLNFFVYLGLTSLLCIATSYICNLFILQDDLISLFLKGIMSVLVPNIVYVLIFYKTPEFQFIKRAISCLLSDYKKLFVRGKMGA